MVKHPCRSLFAIFISLALITGLPGQAGLLSSLIPDVKAALVGNLVATNSFTGEAINDGATINFNIIDFAWDPPAAPFVVDHYEFQMDSEPRFSSSTPPGGNDLTVMFEEGTHTYRIYAVEQGQAATDHVSFTVTIDLSTPALFIPVHEVTAANVSSFQVNVAVFETGLGRVSITDDSANDVLRQVDEVPFSGADPIQQRRSQMNFNLTNHNDGPLTLLMEFIPDAMPGTRITSTQIINKETGLSLYYGQPAQPLVLPIGTITDQNTLAVDNVSMITSANVAQVPLVAMATERGTAVVTFTSTAQGSTPLSRTISIPQGGEYNLPVVDLTDLADGTISYSYVFTDAAANTATIVGDPYYSIYSIPKDTTVSDATFVFGGTGICTATGPTVCVDGRASIGLSNQTNGFYYVTAGETATVQVSLVQGTHTISNTHALDGVAPINISSLDFTSFGTGPVAGTAVFTDTDGNNRTVTFVQNIDRTVGYPYSVSINDGNRINAANQTAVPMTISVDEPGTLEFSGRVSSIPSQLLLAGANNLTLDFSNVSDDSIGTQDDWAMTFKDLAGNVGNAMKYPFHKDTVASTVVVVINSGNVIDATNQSSVETSVTTDETIEGSMVFSSLGDARVTRDSVHFLSNGSVALTPIDLSILPDGLVTVVFTLQDLAGNPTQATASVIKETGVRVPTVTFNNGATINAATAASVPITVTVDEAGSASITVTGTSGTPVPATLTFTAPGPQTANVNVAGLADGNLTASVVFTDAGPTPASAPAVQSVQTKDTQITAPTAVVNAGVTVSSSNASTVSVAVTSSEAGTVSFDTAGSGSPFKVQQGSNTLTVNFSAAVDGIVNETLTFTDLAGNTTTRAITFQKDTVALDPTLVVPAFVNAGTQSSVSMTVTALESGVAALSVLDASGLHVPANNMVLGSQGASDSRTFDLSTLADGDITFHVDFTDSYGNISVQSILRTKDTVAAVPTVLVNNGITINLADRAQVPVVITVAEAGSITSTFPQLGNRTLVAGANTFNLDLTGEPDGPLTGTITFTDEYGNTASPVTLSATKDTVPPVAPTFTFNGGLPINATNKSNTSLEITSAEEGTAVVTFTSGTTTVTRSGIAVAGGTTPVTGIDLSTLRDNTLVAIALVLIDPAGNLSTAVTATTSKETGANPPVVTLSPIALANRQAVPITVTVDEPGQVTLTIRDSGTGVDTPDALVFASANTASFTRDLSGLADGNIVLEATFTDSFTNVSTPASVTAVKDTVVAAPTVVVNNGAAVNNATKGAVPVKLTVTELGSVLFSFAGSALTPVTAGESTLHLDLSALSDGLINGTVVFTDAAGNIALTAPVTGILDTVAPDAPTLLSLNAGQTISATDQTSVTVSMTLSEAGTVAYTITDSARQTVTGSAVAANAGIFSIPGLSVATLSNGQLFVSATLADAAGNVSDVATGTVQKDVPAPVLPSRSSAPSGGSSVRSSVMSTPGNALTPQKDEKNEKTNEQIKKPEEKKNTSLTRKELLEKNRKQQILQPFSDVAPNRASSRAIDSLRSLGIVSGMAGKNDFHPTEEINRASAFKMIILALKEQPSPTTVRLPFSDVSKYPDAWFTPWVSRAWKLGFAQGFNDGTFQPNGLMRRAELLALVYKAFQITPVRSVEESPFADVESEVWYMPLFADAVERGLITPENGKVDPMKFSTREEFAVIVARVLNVK